MLSIDEAIKNHKKLKILAEGTNDKRGAFYSEEEHEQLADWLEELKEYRENSNGYNKEDIELNRNAMYNKAIDDLFEDANEMAIEVDTGTYTMKAIGIGLLEQIAEQLKVGEKNERSI